MAKPGDAMSPNGNPSELNAKKRPHETISPDPVHSDPVEPPTSKRRTSGTDIPVDESSRVASDPNLSGNSELLKVGQQHDEVDKKDKPVEQESFSGKAERHTFAGFLFDLDGTIINTTEAITKHWNK